MLSKSDVQPPAYGSDEATASSANVWSKRGSVRQRPGWSSRPRTPWKKRPDSVWGDERSIKKKPVRPKTPTATFRRKRQEETHDFAPLQKPEPRPKLQEWLRYSAVGLIKPSSKKYKKATRQVQLSKLDSPGYSKPLSLEPLASPPPAPKLSSSRSTFIFDGFSDSDETDSDLDIFSDEDDDEHGDSTQRKQSPTKRCYTGSLAKSLFFSSYNSIDLKREIRFSEEEVATVIDQPQTPRRKYIDVCKQKLMSPEPLLFRKSDASKFLNLSHYGIGDERAEALSSTLGQLPNVSHIDLSDCRMNNGSITHIVEALSARRKDDRLLSLKLTENLLKLECVQAISKLLVPKEISSIIRLVLSSCNLGDPSMRVLADALRYNPSCTALDISKNRIGAKGGKYIAGMLRRNGVLTDLDLSWNSVRGDGALDFIRAIDNSALRRLNVAMNGFGRCGAASLLGRYLPKTSLEYVDLAGNLIDPYTVCIIMNGVVFHSKMKKLILKGNIIGKLGISAVLRTLDHVFQDESRGELIIDLEDTGSDISQSARAFGKLATFDFLEPAGSYELDMSNPEEYALACEILRLSNSKNGCDLSSYSLSKSAKGKYKKIKLRRQDFGRRDNLMGRPVPIVNAADGKPLVIPHDGFVKMKVKVMEHMPKFFNAASDAGFKQVYDIISKPQGSLSRIATMKAACEAFFFNSAQAKLLLQCFGESDLPKIVPIILMRTCVSPEADSMFEEYRHFLEGKFAIFTRAVPTDHYDVDLSDDMERHLVMTLIRISNDENLEASRDEDYQDLSQNGDKSSFRNVTLNGQEHQLTNHFDDEHRLPREGHLRFDFVSRNIASFEETPFEGEIPEDLAESPLKFRYWLRTNFITVKQLTKLVRGLPRPPDYMTLNQKIEGLFHLLDQDGGGEVDKMEVLEAILKNPEVGDFMCQIPELEPLLEPRTFGPAFDAIDQDGGGSLDMDEFKQMCGIATDIADVANAMFDADSDDEWDESEDAELRQKLKDLVANKLNLAARGARERMAQGTISDQLDAVMHMFDECDIGDKEYLMPDEFAELSQNLGVILSPDELEQAVAEIDEDGNGQIEVDEYLDWWGDDDLTKLYEERCTALENGKPYRLLGSQYKGTADERLVFIRDLFNHEDKGNKGYLEPEEFGQLSLQLGVRLGPQELEKAVADIDEDGNGQIEVDEYLDWWGDDELIHLYEMQCDALEAGKPYKMMGDTLRDGDVAQRFAVINHLFELNDEGNKEYLEPREFGIVSKTLGVNLSPYELMKAIEEIDEDGNGQIEVDEYLDWWADPELVEYFEEYEESGKLPQNAIDFARKWFDDREQEKLDQAERKKEEELMAKGIVKKTIAPGQKKVEGEKTRLNRVDFIVASHCRVVDMHNFFRFWEWLSKSEQLELMKRLGWLNTFDPCMPERRHYLDLTNREERVITMMLVRLAMVEPGENWLHEHYFNPNFRPGWELPMSWTQAIPAEGHLVLTYASSLKGCEAVWPERIKLRKFTCIPKAAPLPPEAGVDHGLHTLGFPISYTAFIRLVSSEAPLEETFGKAIHQAEDVFAALKEKENFSPDSDAESEYTDSDEYEEAAERWCPTKKCEKSFFDLIKHHEREMAKAQREKLDLEQVLQVEWKRFLKAFEKLVEQHPNVAVIGKRFDALFEHLDW